MALKIHAAYSTNGDSILSVKHQFGTKDLVISLWENGISVTPSARVVDENEVLVYNVQPNSRIVLIADVQVKTRSKANAEDKQSEGTGSPAKGKERSSKRSAKGSTEDK